MTAQILNGVAADVYHADRLTDRPTLSASLASILCTQSPAHARAVHPRLNPEFERVEEDKFDLGTAVHDVFLEGRDRIFVVHEDTWQKKIAKEARAEARAAGKIPLLAKHRDRVYAMLDALHTQIAEHDADPPLFTAGIPETTIVWDEGDVSCRARLDYLRDDSLAIEDLKTTSRSADPKAFERSLYSHGYDVKAAFYLRGVRAARPGAEPVFRWVVIETAPPYALSVVTPGAEVLALAEAKVEWAINRWRLCLQNDYWAAYGTDVHVADAPAWEIEKWMTREEMAASPSS